MSDGEIESWTRPFPRVKSCPVGPTFQKAAKELTQAVWVVHIESSTVKEHVLSFPGRNGDWLFRDRLL